MKCQTLPMSVKILKDKILFSYKNGNQEGYAVINCKESFQIFSGIYEDGEKWFTLWISSCIAAPLYLTEKAYYTLKEFIKRGN